MKQGQVQIIVGCVLGLIAWSAYRGVTGTVGGLLQDIMDMPGRAMTAVGDAVESVVNGTSIISDPNGGGFVKTAPGAGRVVDYKGTRDVTPLIAYFKQWGNTEAARASASRQGWTADEISLAVLAMASQNGSIEGW